ncbi:MAG: hypothetical protein K2X91_15815, partial [Thermoleophilia bacterium]|nr:hypothetical protein [Thermoleophilia bacterium]
MDPLPRDPGGPSHAERRTNPGDRANAWEHRMRAYLSDVVLLYLDELIDWDSYFNWRRGEA